MSLVSLGDRREASGWKRAYCGGVTGSISCPSSCPFSIEVSGMSRRLGCTRTKVNSISSLGSG